MHATNIATLPARNYMPPSYKPQPRSRFEILKMQSVCVISVFSNEQMEAEHLDFMRLMIDELRRDESLPFPRSIDRMG